MVGGGEANKCSGHSVGGSEACSNTTPQWGDMAIGQVSNGVRIKECDIPAKAATLCMEVKQTSVGCSAGGRQ